MDMAVPLLFWGAFVFGVILPIVLVFMFVRHRVGSEASGKRKTLEQFAPLLIAVWICIGLFLMWVGLMAGVV